jgi:hypothetical protein
MRLQNEQKHENQANSRAFNKISSNLNSFDQEVLAPGVGFESSTM